MDRTACIDIVFFGVQILLKENADWRDFPVAQVTEDNPRGIIESTNNAARNAGLSPGMRLSHALALCPTLRAGTVPEPTRARHVEILLETLHRFSPEVASGAQLPGVFWLDTAGLERLYRSPGVWASAVLDALDKQEFHARMAVGFTRFGTFAMTRTGRRKIIASTPAQEQSITRGISLDAFRLPPAASGTLHQLGVRTLADLLALPAPGVRSRFPMAVTRLRQWAEGALLLPSVPEKPRVVFTEGCDFDEPDADAGRLLFRFKTLLDNVLLQLAAEKCALLALHLHLRLDNREQCVERICPATPTLDGLQIADLVRLRFEGMNLDAGVVAMRIEAEPVPAVPSQLMLFALSRRRNPQDADRALARLRARFGNDAVVRADPGDSHLPEARFHLLPIDTVIAAAPAAQSGTRLIRRIHLPPQTLSARPVRGPAGVHLQGLSSEPVTSMRGPYLVSGGWWEQELRREYYYAQTASGSVLWVYYDRHRHRWFLHGTVE